MDKFLIDPPDNITIDKVVVPPENETVEMTGPPPVAPPLAVPVESPVAPPVESPVAAPESLQREPLTLDDISVPQETNYIETGPSYSSFIKESMDQMGQTEEPIDESLTGESLFPVTKESIEEPVKFSLTRWILWILILVLFIVLALYYAIKYALNESGYIIKKNAKGYKVSLEEMKSDLKNWLRGWVEGIQDWNENLGSKTNQFFFRQHVDKGTFKATKYKIPKNLITPTPNPKA
jgi:hypothetical protein